MKKLPIISLTALVAAASFVGCNSSDYEAIEVSSSSVLISAFSLTEDDSVLTNLDSVFFSIDLVNGRIFNADSLPFGTRTDKLIPVISTLEGASAINLLVTRSNGTDTVYNYLTNSTDTIDFTNPVTIEISSPSATISKRYTVQVNVHRLVGDSMVWDQAAVRPLPTALTAPTAQHTVRNSRGLYVLSQQGSSYSIKTADNPESDTWQTVTPSFPSAVDVASFTATDDALYILAADGRLMTSADEGRSWTAAGPVWHHIYGAYGDAVLGSVRDGSAWKVARHPGGTATALPEGMPVSGTSQALTFEFPFSDGPQMLFIGGTRADGSLSGDTWAYDGSAWARLSTKPVKYGFRDMTLVPFFAFLKSTAYQVNPYSVLLAYGGTDGKVNNDTVYVSDNYGIKWEKASQTMQLPPYIAARHSAQAYVFEKTLGQARSSAAWTEVPLSYRIPATAVFEGTPLGRATEPVTTWTSPFIYTFGGVNPDGSLCPQIWRATLNRFTFKPII